MRIDANGNGLDDPVRGRVDDLHVIDSGTSQVIGKIPVGRKPIRVVVSR